jgi:hypothetical protein
MSRTNYEPYRRTGATYGPPHSCWSDDDLQVLERAEAFLLNPRRDPSLVDEWRDVLREMVFRRCYAIAFDCDQADADNLLLMNVHAVWYHLGRVPGSGLAVDRERRVGDPRAGDGWEAAVARAGVRVPGYPEYLRSTHWELMCAAKTGRCVLCGTTGRTQLHHVDAAAYARLGHERAEDLTELCDSCHRWHSQPARCAA